MRAILTFHSIDDSGSVVSYPPATFRTIIETLLEQHRFVDLDTLLEGGEDGLVVTFDDGMRSVVEHALPVLRANSVPAHLFLTTSTVNRKEPWPPQPSDIPSFEMLDASGIEALVAGGVHIENHTHQHPDLRSVESAEIEDELERADHYIEGLTGRRPRFFAYPFGHHDARVRDIARGRFRAAVTTELGALSKREDPAALPRLDSYYLESPSLFGSLSSLSTRSYLSIRSLLRTVRGSHVPAEPGAVAALRRAIGR